MNARDDFDGLLGVWLDTDTPRRAPEHLLAQTLERSGRTSRRAAWLIPERWLPAGTKRLAAGLVATALLMALALLLALAALFVGSQRRLPPPFGLARPGLVAFDSEGKVFVVNADGTARRQLTTGDRVDSSPSWSRDGTRIAFWSRPNAGGASALVVMGADGRDPVTLDYRRFEADFFYQPGSAIAWSPDGRSVAYAADVDGVSRIFVASTNGQGAKQIGDQGLEGDSPAWSPDGQTIAFRGGRYDVDKGVYLMGADGSNVRRLTSVEGVEGAFVPAWSPDGRWILFIAATYPAHTIWRIGADGSGERLVAEASGFDLLGPTWSPDGSRIAFFRAHGGSSSNGYDGQVVIAEADGSHQSVLPYESLNFTGATDLTWSPDGRLIFGHQPAAAPTFSYGRLRDAIVVQDAVGTEPPVLIRAVGNLSGGDWQRLAP